MSNLLKRENSKIYSHPKNPGPMYTSCFCTVGPAICMLHINMVGENDFGHLKAISGSISTEHIPMYVHVYVRMYVCMHVCVVM